MPNVQMGQLILEAQRMSLGLRELESFSNMVIEEADCASNLINSLRKYHDDIEVLNCISSKKTNADVISRMQQHNANSNEIIKENRELKVIVEDYECAMEMVMQKYREQTMDKLLKNKINFKDLHNEGLWSIIREQREKINEMAAVMHKAASVDDDIISKELQTISHLQLENKTLRELLNISEKFRSFPENPEHMCEMKNQEVQTEEDENTEEVSFSCPSNCNTSSDSVIHISEIVGSNKDSEEKDCVLSSPSAGIIQLDIDNLLPKNGDENVSASRTEDNNTSRANAPSVEVT